MYKATLSCQNIYSLETVKIALHVNTVCKQNSPAATANNSKPLSVITEHLFDDVFKTLNYCFIVNSPTGKGSTAVK